VVQCGAERGEEECYGWQQDEQCSQPPPPLAGGGWGEGDKGCGHHPLPPAPLPQGEGECWCSSLDALYGDAPGGLAGEYARAVHVGDLRSGQFVGAWGYRTHTHR
jgi:hypothetical protein